MKNLLKAEEAAMFILGIFLFSKLSFAWWVFPALLLAPDISMVGYLANPRMGAWLYNLAHHKAIAISVYLAGVYLNNEIIQLSGVILFAHSSMDRILGYGLKYNDAFKHTHLGWIGQN
jgi:hypothetical protein